MPCVVFKYVQQVFSSNYCTCQAALFCASANGNAPRILSRVLPPGQRTQLQTTYHMRCIAFVLHLSALAGPGCVLQGNQQLAACFIDITDNCHSWLPNGQVTGAPPPPQSHMQQLLMYATIILQV
jgi:hypothetical protein